MGLQRSTRDLKLVTLHCAIQETPVSIRSAQDLVYMYPDRFDNISNFEGEYHIVLKPNNHSVIHAQRKCPIYMREEIQTELENMVKQGII